MAASGQDLSCDVYVVGHHGSSSSTSEELLEEASPRYAFLSVGAGNAYGHPTEQTMTALQQHGVALYRTDTQGEVTVYSDGENCWFSTNSCEDWTAGQPNGAGHAACHSIVPKRPVCAEHPHQEIPLPGLSQCRTDERQEQRFYRCHTGRTDQPRVYTLRPM